MSNATLLVFSNPASAGDEAEYNRHYNDIHLPQVCRAPGVLGVTRYRAADFQMPDMGTPAFRYVAIHHLEDAELTLRRMMAAAPGWEYSSATGQPTARYLYEKIHHYGRTD
jgi:hypothetical protein